jgi:glycosyltransferase involved in cell wall biosynthesis
MNAVTDDLLVSLVVPLRNEEATLGRLVESVRSQTRLPEEVILVDGGSSDRTVALARELTQGNPRFRVVQADAATPGRGRNLGIFAANYDWIALTDAGIRLEPTWLAELLAVARREPGLDVIYGNYEPLTRTFFETCAALSYAGPKRERPGGRMRGPFIASSLLRRQVWSAVGGFPDLRAAEDLIFMRRVEEQGFRVGWAPAATVWWELRPTLGSTFRKFIVYSRANAWAGQQRYWHHGVARKYLVGAAAGVLAVLYGPWWLAIPVAGSVARIAKSIWERREGRSLAWAMNPVRFAGVGVVLAAIDVAMFVGWAQASCTAPKTSTARKDGSVGVAKS